MASEWDRPSPFVVCRSPAKAQPARQTTKGDRLSHLFAAYFEASESGYADVFAQLGYLRLNELIDGQRVLFDEGLLVETDLLIEFAHAALDDFVGHLLRFALGDDAGALDILLPFDRRRSDVLFAHELRIGRGDVHRQIVHQLLEVVGAGHEVGFAVDLHHHAELAAMVDISPDESLLCHTAALLSGRGDAALAQHDFRLAKVAIGFFQSALALHHTGAGALAQVFD